MNILSALWILMAWCFSSSYSATHPYVPSCLCAIRHFKLLTTQPFVQQFDRLKTKKHDSSTLLAFCEGNPPVNTELHTQRTNNAKSVSISWCHQQKSWISTYICQKSLIDWCQIAHILGILPKGPYLPCVSMAGRALLAGYPRYLHFASSQCPNLCFANCQEKWGKKVSSSMSYGLQEANQRKVSTYGKCSIYHQYICIMEFVIKDLIMWDLVLEMLLKSL